MLSWWPLVKSLHPSSATGGVSTHRQHSSASSRELSAAPFTPPPPSLAPSPRARMPPSHDHLPSRSLKTPGVPRSGSSLHFFFPLISAGPMAFRRALKKTAIIGGGAVAAVFGLSHLIEYRKTQVSWWQTSKCLSPDLTSSSCSRWASTLAAIKL